MAVATKAAVAGGAGLVLVVVIVVIVVVLLQLQKQTPSSGPGVVQTPGPLPPAPTPGSVPSPSPVAPVAPISSLSVAGPAQAPAIQQIGLTAPPPPPSQIASFIDSLPSLLTGVGIGVAIEAVLHLDVIALKIVTRMNMTPALKAELKLARAAVAERTLAGRMSKAFGRMGVLARAKMGLRWGKTAARSGETVASSTARAGAEAVALSADNGARILATRIAEREAARGALMAVSSVFDAAAIAGLALDLTNTGNYSELVSTGDMRNMKAANDSEVVNTTIACSTWPLGVACPQTPSPAPAPAPSPGPAPPPRAGRYPMFVGPLDAWDADTLDLALSNEFVRLFTSTNPPQSVKDLIADVSSRISTDLGVDTISDTLFIMLCNQYLTPTELENIHNLAFDNVCASEGGVGFLPGNGYDKACSYASKDTCHAAFPWPPPNNDNQDLTYTEWRAKPWFSQWNTITPANIPADGACISADPSIHQMCDEEVGTASGRARNQYIRETGECVNTRDMCRIKGVSYRDSDPPTCYVTTGQQIAELLFGSTIVRFIMSGGKLSLHPDLITTVVTVTIPPVNSGNSTVDTAVNTVSSGLASAAASISNAGITAANAIQSGLVTATNELVNGVAGAVAGTVTVVAPTIADVGVQVAAQAAGTQGSLLTAVASGSTAAIVNTVTGGASLGPNCPPLYVYNSTTKSCDPFTLPPPAPPAPWEHPATPMPPGVSDAILPTVSRANNGTCPSGTTNGSTVGGRDSTSCLSCPQGYTLSGVGGDAVWCYKCPPNSNWVNSTLGCSSTRMAPTITPASESNYVNGRCPTGATNIGEDYAHPCVSCPTGSTLKMRGNFAECRSCEGTYSLSSDGSYCEGKTSCPAGKYLSGPGFLGDCISCPPGTTKTTTGTSIQECIPVTCPAGQYFDYDNWCHACPPNTLKTTTGTSLSECIPLPSTCPAGQYLSGAQCVACPDGTFKETTGTAQRECRTCPPATYAFMGTSCRNCTAGSTCGCPSNTPYSSGDGTCVECYGTSTGCSNGKKCTGGVCSCPAAIPYFTGTACVQCTADSQCPSGQFCRNNQCIAPTAVYSCADSTVGYSCKMGTPCVRNCITQTAVTKDGSMCKTAAIDCGVGTIVCKTGNSTGTVYSLDVNKCTTPAAVSYV